MTSDLAGRLLEAHVAFQIGQLRGDGFAALVAEEVDHALARAGELTLDQVVARQRVKDVAAKYVAGFDLPAAIPEIVGELATRLGVHPANEVPLGAVLPRKDVAALIGRIAAIRPIREWIAVQVTESPSVQAWLAEYLRALGAGAVESNLRMAKKVPGVSLGLSLGGRFAGGAVREADLRSREMAEQAAAALLLRWRAGLLSSVSDEDVSAAALDVWDRASERRIGELLAAVADDDLIDLASIVYDTWLDIRGHAYLASLVDTGVDYFFDTYGGFTLAALLDEFGLDRDDLVEEALRFAPRAIAALDDAGVLADLVRRQLARFYDSPEARDVLAGAAGAPTAP